MLNSTNWVGFLSAIMLIAVSFAAAVLPRPKQPEAPAQPVPVTVVQPSAPLAPIEPPAAPFDTGFIGTHTFGYWTLVCEQVHPHAAAGAPPAESRRICRSNAQKRVKANNEILLAAGFNILYAGPQHEPAVLFRLPPAAKAADHVQFAIDNNTMFQAPMSHCSDDECIVQGILPPTALEELKTGKTLSVIYTANINKQNRPVRVDQSLHGFIESFDALTKATGP